MTKKFDDILSTLKLVFATSKIRNEDRSIDTNDEEDMISDFFDEERQKAIIEARDTFYEEVDGDTLLPDSIYESEAEVYVETLSKFMLLLSTKSWKINEDEARKYVYEDMANTLQESIIFPAIDEYHKNKDNI